MRLDRLQVFQRRCIEHSRKVGDGSAAIAMTLGELNEIVAEVFRLRSAIRAASDELLKAADETWGLSRSGPSGGKT